MSKAIRKDPLMFSVLILSLCMLVFVYSVTYGGVRVNITEQLHNFDTYIGFGDQIWMTEDGHVWMVTAGQASTDSVYAFRFDNWGSSYTRIFTGLNMRWTDDLDGASFGDTVWVGHERNGDYPSLILRLAGTSAVYDTTKKEAEFDVPDGRPGVFMIGTKPAVIITEDGSSSLPDSTFAAILDDAWPHDGSWRILDILESKPGQGGTAPINNTSGVPVGWLLHYNVSGATTYYDTVSGFYSIQSSFHFPPTSTHWEQFQLEMVNDTDGISTGQAWNSMGVSTVKFSIRNVETASPSLQQKDTVEHYAAASIPTDSLCWPDVAAIGASSDSAALYYVDYSDASGDGRIMRRITTNAGATWGTATEVLAAVDGVAIHKMRVTPRVYPDGSGNSIAYLWFTQNRSGDASMAFVIDTVATGAGGPATGVRRRRILQ